MDSLLAATVARLVRPVQQVRWGSSGSNRTSGEGRHFRLTSEDRRLGRGETRDFGREDDPPDRDALLGLVWR